MPSATAFDERDPNYPAVRQLFRDYLGGERTVDVTVALDDDMYSYSCNCCGGRSNGTMAYFRVGLNILDCVSDVAKWCFGGLEKVGSFLDFACGHGRFTRVLAAVYPKSRIWASEILSDAVRFQRDQLGVNALQSATKPEDFNPGRTFDFIYVGSLFTHLPDQTFARWLKQLYELLTPNGVLAFSTHGVELLKTGASMPDNGIYYIPQTEIPSLNPEDYGATLVSTDYVRRVIGHVTGREEHWHQNRALGSWQDLWLISRAPLPKAGFTYDQGPQGHVDYVHWNSPSDLSMQCWAACICPDHTISEIRVSLNGEYCGSVSVNYARPDVADHLKNPGKLWTGSRGSVRTSRPINPWEDVLSVVAVCSGGKQFALRTAAACSMLQFPGDARPVSPEERYSEASSTTRGKLHRALDYAVDRDWRALGLKTLDFLRGK